MSLWFRLQGFTRHSGKGKARVARRPSFPGNLRLFKTAISFELRLAAACCGPNSSQAADSLFSLESIDWDRFRAVVRRHRIEPLVNYYLPSTGLRVPPQVIASLKEAAATTVAENLRYAVASDQLLRQCQKVGIDLLFVKGLTLSKLAYGTIALKKGWDIDVLVAEEQVVSASRVLRELGYECTIPGAGLSDDEMRCWAHSSKESVWHNASRGVFVELHSRLVDNEMLLTGSEDFQSARVVEIVSGVALPTLREERLFAYLCVHGAASAWFRLKWLADFAALIREKDSEEIERLYRKSKELGAGRAAAQALLLSETLLGIEIPAELARELRANRANLILYRISLHMLDGGRPEAELGERRLGTVPIHLAQFLLLPGWRFKIAELYRQTSSVWHRLARQWSPASGYADRNTHTVGGV